MVAGSMAPIPGGSHAASAKRHRPLGKLGTRPRLRGGGAHSSRGESQPMRRSLHHAVEAIESLLQWQPPRAYTLLWEVYHAVGRDAEALRLMEGCTAMLKLQHSIPTLSQAARKQVRPCARAGKRGRGKLRNRLVTAT